MHRSVKNLLKPFCGCSARRCLGTAFLPLALAVIFVIQNVAYNAWLDVVPEPYLRIYGAALALGLLLYGPAIFLRARWRLAYLAVVSALVSMIFIAEYLYFSYSGGFLQASSLLLWKELGVIGGTIWRLLTPRLLLFAVSPLLVLAAALLAHGRGVRRSPLTVREAALIALLILTMVGGGYGVLYATETSEWGNGSRLYSKIINLDVLVGKMGVVNYFLEDAVKRLVHGGRVSAEDKAFVRQWSAARPAPPAHGGYFGMAKGHNLIFIQVESLENAVIGAKLGAAEITPNLNALAGQGLYFSNYFAPSSAGSTADVEFSTLNSLYPLPDGVAFVERAQNRYAALPRLLADNGYSTHVLHGDTPAFWNRANIYPNLGYRSWFMKKDYTIIQKVGITGLSDGDFFRQSLPMIERLPQPFMATLITLSAHTPFTLPDDLKKLPILAGNGLDHKQFRYLESIHYTDQVLGEFIDQLKRSAIYDHSIVVIFGDHESYTGIDRALKDEYAAVGGIDGGRVPLIILAPGTGLNGERKIPASHIDLYPTVAHLLGLDVPRSVLGQDLLNTATPVVVHRDRGTGSVSAIVGGRLFYLASIDGEFEHGACRRADTRQPVPTGECRALYDEQSAILRVSDAVVRGNLIDALLSSRGGSEAVPAL